MEQKRPITHVAWAQHWVAGRFREWLEVGRGRIDFDADGNPSAHTFQNRLPVGGWTGYTCLLPIGVKPQKPTPEPQRPGTPPDDEI